MKDRHSLEPLVTCALLTAPGPSDLRAQPGTPKPLRPQARRLLDLLDAEERLARFRRAAALLGAAAAALTMMLLLPDTLAMLDVGTVRACLGTAGLIAVLSALHQADRILLQRRRRLRAI